MRELSPLEQRLGIELRAIRAAAGMSQAAMAAKIGTSQKTVSRIESPTDDRLPDRDELAGWLSSADDDTRARIRVLFDAAHVEAQSWASLRRSGHIQAAAAEDEEIATRMRCYTSGYVPGLLQTDEYALRLMPLVDPGGDHAAAVAARMQRQRRLYEQERTFEFLVAEAALLWRPADAVVHAQRARLESVATLPNVTIGVMPSRRVGAPAWHDFIIWDAPEDVPSWVTIEMAHARARTADPELVGIYTALWNQMWDAALHGDDALGLIRG